MGLFGRLGWKDYSMAILAVVLVFLVIDLKRKGVELEQARLVYKNPETKIVEKTVTVVGPVRIRTIIVERPDGIRETTTEETREVVNTTVGLESSTNPVPLAVTLVPARTDRWLLGVQAGDGGKYTGLVGYGFRNRLDVLAGGGTDGVRLQVVARF